MVTIQGVIEALAAAYGDLVVEVVAFVAGFAVTYAVGRWLVEPTLRRLLSVPGMERTVRQSLEKAVRGAVVAVALLVALAVAGFGTVIARSAIVLAAVTVALGFAAQDVVGNFVAGVVIVADPAFNIDDWIEWDGQSGVIDDISFRATRVRTFDNEIVTVPNLDLVTTPVTNPVITDRLRVTYAVSVGYDDDVPGARHLLVAAAEAHDGVLADPGPEVVVVDLGESDVTLEARFWLPDPDHADVVRVRSEYGEAVRRRFAESGIDLATTTRHDLSGGIDVRETRSVDRTGTGS